MGSWFRQFEALIWAATLAAASLLFAYQSFATKEYVELRHNSAMDVLQDIKESQREMRSDIKELMKK